MKSECCKEIMARGQEAEKRHICLPYRLTFGIKVNFHSVLYLPDPSRCVADLVISGNV